MKKIADLIHGGTDDGNRRVFQVPEDYDGDALADALAGWMGEQLAMTAENLPVADGWLVQADDTTGMLGRLVRRRAASLYVRMQRREDGLHVRLGYGRWKKDPAKAKERGAGLWDMASAAVDAGVELAGSAASGVSDLLVETRTVERIFQFIDRSAGEVSSWHWDFGDGTVSGEQHPVHRYREGGNWTVILTVEGPSGTSVRSKVWDVVSK